MAAFTPEVAETAVSSLEVAETVELLPEAVETAVSSRLAPTKCDSGRIYWSQIDR